MHTLSAEELLDQENHAWEELKELLDSGQITYVYVPAQRKDAEDTLYRLQVSTKSYLGAVAYETEGIVLDHGWQNGLTQIQRGQVFAYHPPLWTQEGGGDSSSKAPALPYKNLT